jgi:hypothetical protein
LGIELPGGLNLLQDESIGIDESLLREYDQLSLQLLQDNTLMVLSSDF